jgi:hypothetical protein
MIIETAMAMRKKAAASKKAIGRTHHWKVIMVSPLSS